MGKVAIDLFVMDECCDPYICGVRGSCTIEDLQAIQKEIVENRVDHLPNPGTYAIEAFWYAGQFDEHGRCEMPPAWEWEIADYSPFDLPEV